MISNPLLAQHHLRKCCLLLCLIKLSSAELQLQSEARVYCLCSSSPCQLLADCFVYCRFNDFLCHTSGMGTVDNEKVLVGTLPSKSLYEYCFHPDQQCWKVNIPAACLLLLKLKRHGHALASA